MMIQQAARDGYGFNQGAATTFRSVVLPKPTYPIETEQRTVRWSWSCRHLPAPMPLRLVEDDDRDPRPGDIVLVGVGRIGNHTKIMTAEEKRLRIYTGDWLIGVMGNRYATDAYEAEVDSIDHLHLLTNAGMIGTIRSKHSNQKRPTEVAFLGYVADEQGHRLNLKQRFFQPTERQQPLSNIIFTVGSGMNSGKTTTSVKLIKALLAQGLRVAACKLTGSISTNDHDEYIATGAHFVRDFSHYGFPSTYLCSDRELMALFNTMMCDAEAAQPEVTVVEIADGLLQRETRMLLESFTLRNQIAGIVLAAPCASSALYGVEHLRSLNHNLIGVSGVITNSPLFVREFATHNDIAIAPSTDDGSQLAQLVTTQLGMGLAV